MAVTYMVTTYFNGLGFGVSGPHFGVRGSFFWVQSPQFGVYGRGLGF